MGDLIKWTTQTVFVGEMCTLQKRGNRTSLGQRQGHIHPYSYEITRKKTMVLLAIRILNSEHAVSADSAPNPYEAF